MKKLFTFLFLLFIWTYCFSIDFDINPKISSIEIKDPFIVVYITWVDNVSYFEWYVDDTKVSFAGLSKTDDSKKLLFSIPNKKNSWEFKVIAYKVYQDKKRTKTKNYDSNKIDIKIAPSDFYIKWWLLTYNPATNYDINLFVENRDKFEWTDIFINDKKIAEDNIIDKWNIINIKNYKDFNWENVIYVKIDEDNLNSLYWNFLEKELVINFSRIEKDQDLVNIYLSAIWTDRDRDDVNVYLNNSLLSKDKWRFYKNNIILDIDKYSSTEEYEIYISKWDFESNKILVNVSDYLFTPYISSFKLTSWNKKWYNNIILWKDLWKNIDEIDYIKINDKSYTVLWKSYSSRRKEWYPELKEKYDSSVEKAQIQSQIDKKDQEWESIIFSVTNNSNELKFKQPILFNWENNSIQLWIRGKSSNVLEFVAEEWNWLQSFKYIEEDEETEDNSAISFNFYGEELSWYNYDKDTSYKIWILSINNWWWKDYNLNKIVFKLRNKSWTEFIPIKDIKLGEYIGFVEKVNEEETNIIFENILLKDLKYQDINLEIYLPSNYKNLELEIIPDKIIFQNMNHESDNNVFEYNMKSSPVTIYSNLLFSNCFDTVEDYSNCIWLWYEDKTKYEYVIWTSNDYLKKQEELKKQRLEEKRLLDQKKTTYATRYFQKIKIIVNKVSSQRNIPKEKLYKLLYEYFYIKVKSMDWLKKDIYMILIDLLKSEYRKNLK